MPADLSKVLGIFSKFLQSDIAEDAFFSRKGKVSKIKNIDDVLKLPIYSFNFIDEKDAKIMEEILDIFDIGEAAKLDQDNPFSKLMKLESTDDPIGSLETQEELQQQIGVLKDKFPSLETTLSKAIRIASLLQKVKEEEVKAKKTEQKVVATGLDNAGKTAILKKFGGRLGIADLAKLQPTKGVERKIIKSEKIDLYLWDFGGQEKYRKGYLENVDQYFLEIDLLIYVIDVQDSERFDQSFDYFEKVMETLITLEENPHILIFIHKYDPDLENDPQINLNVEYLKDKIQDLIAESDFNYEVYLTSIYSLISKEPQFSRYIKDLMNSDSISDPTVRKVEGMGRILEEIMNAIIRLSESLSLQLNNMDERLRAIESGTVQIAENGHPHRIEAQEIEKREYNVRSSVLGELRDLFAKKKRLNL